ncbi:MAG: 4Fe-4S dicluster domain-containing protein [Thermoanaerobaculum sp.]
MQAKETILPFAGRPEGRIPGVPQYFATVMALFGNALGLVVTSYDGRPIKVEGNPQHPESRGATHLWAQASVLELYDPDRSQVVVERQAGQRVVSNWENFQKAFAAKLAEVRVGNGEGLWVLSDATPSPTRQRLRAKLAGAFPRARWLEFDPLLPASEPEGLARLTGVRAVAKLKVENARVIASFGSDFLMMHPSAVANARGFAQRRREGANRVYVAEPIPTVTGAAADHRLAVRPERLERVFLALAQELSRLGLRFPGALPDPGLLVEGERDFVARCARDVLDAGKKGLIVVGDALPPAAHALAFVLNRALGAQGETVAYVPAPPPLANLHELAAAGERGEVQLLVILGGNPVATALHVPWTQVLARTHVVRLGLFEDETSRLATWHVPQAHFLESWGDLRALGGEYSVVQPLIAPLYDGKTAEELLSLAVGEAKSAYELVRETFAEMAGAGWEQAFQRTLHDGIWEKSVATPLNLAEKDLSVLADFGGETVSGLTAVRLVDYKVLDGRFANNPWLQELPDPMSKLTWGNAALVSPSTAAALGLRHGEVVRVAASGQEVVLPCFVLPGTAPDTVGLVAGYGRKAAGRVGNEVGSDVLPLFAQGWTVPVAVTPTGRRGDLASTQDYQAMDRVGLEALGHRLGELIREVPAAALAQGIEPLSAPQELRPPMPFRERPMTGEYQWGMVVDLAACIGCGACVVACQAENNIPVVGKKQVQKGRQMHWIRIDRYFSGKPEEPKFAFQPVLCQHCENAPCEQVCPVAATVHNEEGLNQMVYNRCVGTRYCSNNCPYKVRRFNYFNYFKQVPEVRKMQFNPEVTVRGRGVMEKCTFCIQRIEKAKIAAHNERRPLRDGEVVPACAQVCPTEAIVFGNLADPESQVARLQRDVRAYGILTELNTRPRVLYLAKITNQTEAS